MWVKKGFEILSEEAFSEIYRAFWKKLYLVSYNHVRDKTIAQELVQDVFVKLWVKRAEISQVEDAQAYLFRCLRNKIYDYFDSVAARNKKLSHCPLEDFSNELYSVDENTVFEEGMSVISEELEKMPEKTRIIFQMSKFGRYSNDEIAIKMHVSAKAVEYHITQAVKKLRVRLAVFLS
jgi:RNA polymerase sigma-70 factor (ECF subfamily)